MSFSRTTMIAMLVLAAGTSVAHAQTTDAHHPADQGTAAPAAPVAGVPAPQSGTTPMGMAGQGGAAGMPTMMGNMMQMMGGMMQMMPAMCGSMMPAAPAAGAMGGRMERGGMGLFGSPPRHVEGHLAFYKAELAITDAQQAQWNAFAEAVRAGAKLLAQAGPSAMQADTAGSALDDLQRRVAHLSAQLESLKLIQAAAGPLYAVLSADQKKVADELIAEHPSRM
jgi:hypothetical protein